MDRKCDFIPEHAAAVKRGNFLFIDEKGGIGAYPAWETPKTSVNFTDEGWQVSLFLRG